ncbi:LamG domain-containing protein [Sphingomonas cannabina]|uniref:LamG domain-containing protein n=1 Tax=Sphingomonas cannabina TaxID=2899123 RepID=UPI001F1D814B|nr:LamG domain-containing protein [Sphingomonas cannabina]UIJ46566.1 LamG domain-containing protein [Sphingomonas cannabina]
MVRRHGSMLLTIGAAALLTAGPARADDAPGLLFHVSADTSLTADRAGGDAVPNFASKVAIDPTGKTGGAIRWEDDGYVTWNAPGNIQARRGTLAFFWRSRYPVGEAPFVLFRVGFADHSSWDMAFLRIDWNGHGFDAFVTDTNLARERVSFRMDALPAPDTWHHIAFVWDEAVGVRLYVDGKEVARKDGQAVLDSGLDQFGLAGRVIAPHQVQSRYNFMRGSDLDDIRVYDRMLPAADIAALAGGGAPSGAAPLDAAGERRAFLHRYGFDKESPPALTAASTRIRKVEFADARDLKQWMWKGVDGIPETTWPGVYNRSRLPGRNDYFTLPDWNTYVEGGKAYELTIPPGEAVNRVEIRGAAYGGLDYAADGKSYARLARRPQGIEKSIHSFSERTGGRLRFTNIAQETPIQEIWAYDVQPGAEPEGTVKLSYTVDSKAAPGFAALAGLNAFIAGRYPPAERATVVALPASRGGAAVGAGSAAAAGEARRIEDAAPLVHILIPSGFSAAAPDRPLARAWNYTWANAHDGLDGIALDMPALKVAPNRDGLIPLNIRVKDPIWPERDMIDVSVSVRPGEARTLWLDLRDRILTEDSLYLAIASAAPDFGPASIDGMKIRLVFKDRAAAKAEHVADRFNQVRDNWGFLVEEHTASAREAMYRRVKADITDLLRVDPDNLEGRRYWADISYGATGMPPFTQPVPPAGVPLWAFRQLEDLKLTRRFVDWWIDNRQVPYGDFGGGISDDTDLTQQWPGLALMGVEPDKINASLRALSDAVYANGMNTGGLGTITTDELHAYEEGMNSDAERLYLNWGEPRAVERLMATTKALTGIIQRNPAGHMHFASNWYGGTKVYREGPWEWQKPYSFVVMHAPILMGVYNGNPTARGLVTGVIDGWLAHGKQDAKGAWSYPNEINWRTDAERAGDGGGVATPYQSVWAAWRFTGDDRYLAPILSRVAKGGPASLGDLNENVVAALGRTNDWGKALAGQPGDFARVAGWDATGDKRLLETLHADAIEDKTQHEYMYTEGHWWSDRVDQPNEFLQRERLGGIALKRNQTYPGNAVSWRFANPGAAEQVAILVPGATRERFKVIAYNMSDVAQPATMTAWNVAAGRWTMTAGTSAANGDTADGPPTATEVTLERSASVAVTFAPRTTTVLEFALKSPGTPPESRPDLGIGADDVRRQGRTVSVTVHSLGAVEAAGGTAMLEDAAGKPVASVPLPTLAAPLDLTPKAATVRLTIPAGVHPAGLRVRVALPDEAPEVTRLNNAVPLQ